VKRSCCDNCVPRVCTKHRLQDLNADQGVFVVKFLHKDYCNQVVEEIHMIKESNRVRFACAHVSKVLL